MNRCRILYQCLGPGYWMTEPEMAAWLLAPVNGDKTHLDYAQCDSIEEEREGGNVIYLVSQLDTLNLTANGKISPL